jgi:hypothetical protein
MLLQFHSEQRVPQEKNYENERQRERFGPGRIGWLVRGRHRVFQYQEKHSRRFVTGVARFFNHPPEPKPDRDCTSVFMNQVGQAQKMGDPG